MCISACETSQKCKTCDTTECTSCPDGFGLSANGSKKNCTGKQAFSQISIADCCNSKRTVRSIWVL